MSKETLYRSVDIPKAARRRTYYDTEELVQNQSVVEFYPAQANRKIEMANYIQNPFPGEDARLVYGISLEIVKQYINSDSANSIDGEEIINAVKNAGIIVTADQDSREFLRNLITDHFNFEGTHLNTRVTLAGQAAANDQEETVKKTVTIQASDLYRVPDPFTIAPNQVLNFSVHFGDSSVFPTGQNWDDANQTRLYMRSKLHVAELTPAMQKAMGM